MKEQEVEIGGCMAGFFNIFDRPHHLLSPKRISASESKKEDSGIQQQRNDEAKQGGCNNHNNNNNKSSPLWRFSKDAPRLSLDSRAVVDAKGSLKPKQEREEENQRGSPSVIARLMGLEEPLPSLQRSASESRLRRRFVDFQNPVSDEKESSPQDPVVRSARAQPARATATQMKRQMDDLETLEALRLKGLLHSSNRKPHQPPPIKPARPPFGTRSRSPPARRRQRRLSPPEPLQSRASQEVKKQLVQIWKVDEYNRQGETLLERCDKLLHSIAEMAASEAGDSQPSPVSVLDASLYHEDSSPSPVMKRTLHFQEDQSWEYVYISDILRASDCLPQESDIFSFLEKHQFFQKGKHYIIPHERRLLIFDAVQEILAERRRLPPWRRVGEDDEKMQLIWFEFQKMRKTRPESSQDDLVGRDLSGDRWQDCEVEMSEAVLDIERLIFKDLIGDTIRDLPALNRSHSLLRRRLVFF